MNTRSSFDRCLSIVLMVMVATATCPLVMADIPMSGSISALTPYTATAEPNFAEVKQKRLLASQSRCIKDARIRGSKEPIFGDYVGFLSTKAERYMTVGEMPTFELTLYQQDKKKTVVTLGIVESFKVLKIKEKYFFGLFGKEKALLEFVLFPTINIEDLLEKPIIYRDLKKQYTTTVKGWVNLREKGGKHLCLVAQESGKYHVLTRIKNLEPKRAILFGYRCDKNSLWWAVSSVTEDSTYPYISSITAAE